MPTIPIPARRAKKTQPPNGATNTSSLTAAPGPGQPVFAPPPKMRRRPFVWLTGAALVILSALTAAWAYRSIGQGHDIVALRSTVHRGEVITREDLMTVRIGTDPALHPLSAAQINDAVGKRAALDLAAGGVLTQEAMTPVMIPPTGSSLIGVQLTTARMPSETLRAGDKVRLIALPKDGALEDPEDPDTTSGIVLSTHSSPRGDGQVVDVQVTVADAPLWAARAATNQVALTLETRDR